MLPENDVTIGATQRRLKKMYENNEYSFDYIYGYASRHASFMCKNLWQNNSSKNDFIRTISWLFAIASKFDIDLEKGVLRRHPGVCPYCLTAPCQCIKTRKRPANRTPAHKITEFLEEQAWTYENNEEITFSLYARLLEKIYPNNRSTWADAGPWKHCMKVLEEIGEIHEAASGVIKHNKPKQSLTEEIADAFAWTVGAWIIVHEESDLGEELAKYYSNGCPVCSKEVCTCAEREGRSLEFPDRAAIAELRKRVTELSKLLRLEDEQQEELEKSLDAAEQLQTESVTKRAFSQADDLADTALKGLGKTEDGAKKAAGIAKSIKAIVENWPF